MEDQAPQESNYYQTPEGPRFSNPQEFAQAQQQPAVPPLPDFQAMREAALQQAIEQVKQRQNAQPPTPQQVPQSQAPTSNVVYLRRNLTIAEFAVIFAIAIGGVLGVQGLWHVATDIVPRIEIRSK